MSVSVAKRPSSGDTIEIGNAVGKTVYEFTHKNRAVEEGRTPIYIRRSKKDMAKDLQDLVYRETHVTIGVEVVDGTPTV